MGWWVQTPQFSQLLPSCLTHWCDLLAPCSVSLGPYLSGGREYGLTQAKRGYLGQCHKGLESSMAPQWQACQAESMAYARAWQHGPCRHAELTKKIVLPIHEFLNLPYPSVLRKKKTWLWRIGKFLFLLEVKAFALNSSSFVLVSVLVSSGKLSQTCWFKTT